jgi:hypothetical protein
MKCGEIGELLSLYVDRLLDEKRCSEFEEHIGICSSCRKELEDINRVIELCNSVEEVELPDGFREELHLKLMKVNRSTEIKNRILSVRSRYFKIFSSIAAVLLLVIFVKGIYDSGLFIPVRYYKGANSEKTAEAPNASGLEMAEYAGAQAQADSGQSESQAIQNETEKSFDTAALLKDPARSENDESRSIMMKAGSSLLTVAKSVDITVTLEEGADMAAQVQRINELAIIFGAEKGATEDGAAQRSVRLEKADIMGGSPEESDDSSVMLEIRIPAVKYDEFTASLAESFENGEVTIGQLNCEDKGEEIELLNNRLSEIDRQIADMESGNSANSGDLEEARDNREAVLEEIEKLQLDSDFITVRLNVRTK